MFREMRRKKQNLSEEETKKILARGTSGVLALLGDVDYPYAVPISYVCCGSKLYFHSAKSGHKIDAIRKCQKASFCVIDKDIVIPEKYTTAFRSAVAFGQIRILTEETEMKAAIKALAEKYYPGGSEEEHNRAIEKDWKSLCMIEFSIEHLSGKAGIELNPSSSLCQIIG